MFKLTFKTPEHGVISGIYKIAVGGKFYIGKANIPILRAKQHESGINKALRLMPMREMLNSKNDSAYKSYDKFAEYLADNPSINSGSIELIQRGRSPFELYHLERYHLGLIRNHPDSLNTLFSSPRPRHNDYHHCDAKIYNGVLAIINPITGGYIIPCTKGLLDTDMVRKAMDISLNEHSYKAYRISVLNNDYQEKSVYLSPKDRLSLLNETMAKILAL